MDTTWIGISLIVCWILTGLFVLTVTFALELIVYKFGKRKWLHGVPVLAGLIIAGPAMYMVRGFGMTLPGGFPVVWIVLVDAILLSLLGIGLGRFVSR